MSRHYIYFFVALIFSNAAILAQVTEMGPGVAAPIGTINQSDINFSVSGVVLDLEVEVAVVSSREDSNKRSHGLVINLIGPNNVAKNGVTGMVTLFTHNSRAICT